jgi:endonuclease/exonuclease/phosphatase family metal-dependent hydrolase
VLTLRAGQRDQRVQAAPVTPLPALSGQWLPTRLLATAEGKMLRAGSPARKDGRRSGLPGKHVVIPAYCPRGGFLIFRAGCERTVAVTRASDRAAGGELLFLHWNVHSWRDAKGRPNLDAVTALLARHRPDVVSLVEVNEPWAAPAALPALARQAGYSWLFWPAVELGGDVPDRGYGNALLARRPILAAQQWRLTWPATIYDGTEPSEARSVALARVALPGVGVWAGSTHLPATRRDARAAVLRLTEVTRHLDPPWVICGDFNTRPSAWLKRGQPIVVAPRPARPTFPARFPVRALDYCIASPGVALRARRLHAAGSDHLPILVRCQVPAGEPPA